MRKARTIQDELAGLASRHATLSKPQKTRLGIYVGSLRARLIEIQYASKQINRLSISSTEEPEPFEDVGGKREFYANCFWALSYSAYDILAHIVNVIHRKITNERYVSFGKLATNYSGSPNQHTDSAIAIPQDAIDAAKRIRNRQHFKRLDGYRHTYLHRRGVCLKDSITTEKLSTAYQNSTDPQPVNLITLVCDDPDELSPKFDKQRKLCVECDTIYRELVEDLKSILRVL